MPDYSNILPLLARGVSPTGRYLRASGSALSTGARLGTQAALRTEPGRALLGPNSQHPLAQPLREQFSTPEVQQQTRNAINNYANELTRRQNFIDEHRNDAKH